MSDPGDLGELAALTREIEALLFAAAQPLTVAGIAQTVSEPGDVSAALGLLQASYAARGFVIIEQDSGWRFKVAPGLEHVLATERPVTRRLPKAALATLAIIAWHEPVTRAEIAARRGVGVSAATLDLLLGLGWIKGAVRRDAPGRPMHYATTPAFLAQFGLSDRRDLPGVEDLRAAGLLDAVPDGDATPGAVSAAKAAADGAELAESDRTC